MSDGGSTLESLLPQIDVVETSLLDGLHPEKSTGDVYLMDCKACGRLRTGSYRRGGHWISCSSCNGLSISEYLYDHEQFLPEGIDAVLKSHYREILSDTETRSTRETPGFSELRWTLQRLMAIHNRPVRDWLYSMDLSRTNFATEDIGYLSTTEEFEAMLLSNGGSRESAVECGALSSRAGARSPFEGCVVGFWEQPNGGFKLWGLPISQGTAGEYIFSKGFTTAIPYTLLTRTRLPLVLCKDPIDVFTLRQAGLYAAGRGGDSISEDQAQFLVLQGFTQVFDVIESSSPNFDDVFASLVVCESLGVSYNLSVVPDEIGGIKGLRGLGDYTLVSKLPFELSMTGGEFLARYILEKRSNTRTFEDSELALAYVPSLTPCSRQSFDQTAVQLGLLHHGEIASTAEISRDHVRSTTPPRRVGLQ